MNLALEMLYKHRDVVWLYLVAPSGRCSKPYVNDRTTESHARKLPNNYGTNDIISFKKKDCPQFET